MRLAIFILLLSFVSGTAIGQTGRDSLSWYERVGGDAWSGAMEVTKWYDYPLGAVFLARNYYKEDNLSTKIFIYPAMPFEQDIADDLRKAGRSSLGSMGAWMIPAIVIGSRLAWTIGRNVAGKEDLSAEYGRIWTFSRVLMYNFLATELVKNTVRRSRPDGGDTKSFFSGHTSTAFVTSAYLYRELDDILDAKMEEGLSRDAVKAAGFSVLYGWAAYVGYSRMADSKHYLLDVLVGASVGSLIGNLIYAYYYGESTDHLPKAGISVIDDQPVLTFSLQF
jgi:membrane-associated phospholipid phosphatase